MYRLLFFIFLVLISKHAYSADDLNTDVSLSLTELYRLELSDTSILFDLSDPGTAANAYDNGQTIGSANTPLIKISSNTGWALTVHASINWNMVSGYQKETSDLLLKVNDRDSSGHLTGFSSYESISLTPQQIASYTGGANKERYGCRFKILLDYTKDIPGDYSITLTYTLSTSA